MTIGVATGLLDRNGRMIRGGDLLALHGETCDGSMGELPSGFLFDPSADVYRIMWDPVVEWWRLVIDVPDSEWNRKYIDHANTLVHTPENVEVIDV